MKKIHLPLDASAKAVLERAREESARLHHEYVGTEHLALAPAATRRCRCGSG